MEISERKLEFPQFELQRLTTKHGEKFINPYTWVW